MKKMKVWLRDTSWGLTPLPTVWDDMAVGPPLIICLLAWLSPVFSERGTLAAPANLNVTSSHFKYLLTWQPGSGTPRGVTYNVCVSCDQYFPWVPVAGCDRVEHPLVCNLTGAFTNLRHVYYSRVVAVLGSQASPPAYTSGFKPIVDGELALPRLTLAACDSFLCVDLHPPLERVRELYESFQYELHISSSSSSSHPAERLERTMSLSRYALRDLAPGREHCVSVRILDPPIHRELGFGPVQCASTPATGAHSKDVALVVLSVILVLGLLVGGLLVHTGVLCLKSPLPSVLDFTNPLGERRLAEYRKEPVCSHMLISAKAPSAGGKRKCTAGVDDGVSEKEKDWDSGSILPGRGYELPFSSLSSFSSSSCSLASCFSTPSPLVRPLQPERPPLYHRNPHTSGPLAAVSPPRCRSDHHAKPNVVRTPASVAAPALDQHALQLCVQPLEKEVEVCDDVNLLSLTFGLDRLEDAAYRATPPPTTEEEEVVSMGTVISVEDEEDDQHLGGYLRR